MVDQVNNWLIQKIGAIWENRAVRLMLAIGPQLTQPKRKRKDESMAVDRATIEAKKERPKWW